jgi:hypothetical protein
VGTALDPGSRWGRRRRDVAHLIRRCREIAEAHPRTAWPRHVKVVLQDALDVRDRVQAGAISAHGAAVARGHLTSRASGRRRSQGPGRQSVDTGRADARDSRQRRPDRAPPRPRSPRRACQPLAVASADVVSGARCPAVAPANQLPVTLLQRRAIRLALRVHVTHHINVWPLYMATIM